MSDSEMKGLQFLHLSNDLKSFSEETLRESVHAENEKGCAGSEPV